jgi:hypothetical protein
VENALVAAKRKGNTLHQLEFIFRSVASDTSQSLRRAQKAQPKTEGHHSASLVEVIPEDRLDLGLGDNMLKTSADRTKYGTIREKSTQYDTEQLGI